MRRRVTRHKGRENVLPTAGNTGRWACIAPSSTPSFPPKKKRRKLLKRQEQTCTAPWPVVCEGGDAPSALHHLMKESTHVGGRPGGRTTAGGGGAGLYEELLMPQRRKGVEVEGPPAGNDSEKKMT